LFLAVSLSGLNAEQFTEVSVALEPMRYATLQWGDYDNDGDLDILAAGARYIGAPFENSRPTTIVYRNDGNNLFSIADTSMLGIQQGSATWGDYDNDGDLDVFLNGMAKSIIGLKPVAFVYRNDGNDTFVNVAVLDSLEYPYGTWGDYNNDGYLDLILTGDIDPGIQTLQPVSILYRNDQSGGFFRNDTTLIGVAFGGAEFADYDNDSDLDLILTGLTLANGYISTIYQNTNGNFTNVNPGFLGLIYSKSAWSDFDSDGDFDVVLGGQEGGISQTRSKFYRNEGGDTFSEVFFSSGDTLPDLGRPSFDWGDFDNDGDPDLLMTGQIGLLATRYTAIFRNEGNSNFTALKDELVPVRTGDAKWGDFDNDGDLDIILCGTDTTGVFGEFVTKVYQNNLVSSNFSPTAPNGLNSDVSNRSVTLSWTPSTDNETPQVALTYNLRIGTAPGQSDVLSPMAIEQNGFRKLPQMGNTNMNTSWILNDLAQGIYYWSVQTIDGAMAGSAFSVEKIFTIDQLTDLDDPYLNVPTEFMLFDNYPNPFNPETVIGYQIIQTSEVQLDVYNISGQKIRRLVNERQKAGVYEVFWDGRNDLEMPVATGIYLYQLRAANHLQRKKMVLLK
jgi:hypothetical protein